jgi:hypothetical protein
MGYTKEGKKDFDFRTAVARRAAYQKASSDQA